MLKTAYSLFTQYDIHSIICFLLVTIFMYAICKPKNKRLRLWMYAFAGCVSFAAVYTYVILRYLPDPLSVYGRPYAYYYFCNIALTLFWSGVFLRNDLFTKITYLLYFYLCIHLYNTAVSPIHLSEGIASLPWFPMINTLICVGQYILLFVFFSLFQRFNMKNSVLLDKPSKAIIIVVPLLVLVGDILLMLRNDIVLGAPFLAAVLLLDIPAIYFLVYKVIKEYEDKRRLDENIAHLQAEQAVFRQLSVLRQDIRQERHELKSNYFKLQTLLHQQKYDELSAQLDSIAGELNEKLQSLDTGSTFLDYMLSQKVEMARSKSIPICTEIILTQGCKVDEFACGAIIANLLDNAIEASEKEADPGIVVSMRVHQGYFICQITNKTSIDIKTLNPLLKTTKSDKDAHGYGLRVARRKTREQNGILDTYVENGRFVAVFMVPLTTSP